jgi:hypothetical protein
MKIRIYDAMVGFEKECRAAWNDVNESDRDVFWKAVRFVGSQIAWAYEHGLVLDIPDIGPGPDDGSIDVHWCTKKYELLVNVKRSEQAAFYGDDYGERKIKGSFDIEDTEETSQEFLSLWSLA